MTTQAPELPLAYSLRFQGQLVKLTSKNGTLAGGGHRRSVATFSAASRKRMLDMFAKLDFTRSSERPKFITLTYKDTYPSALKAKEHLWAFLARLKRLHSDLAVVWRLEFQRRGAPHFHLMVFHMPYLDKKEVARMWHEITYQGVGAAPFTRIEAIRSHKGLMAYCSKYLAKSPILPKAKPVKPDPYSDQKKHYSRRAYEVIEPLRANYRTHLRVYEKVERRLTHSANRLMTAQEEYLALATKHGRLTASSQHLLAYKRLYKRWWMRLKAYHETRDLLVAALEQVGKALYLAIDSGWSLGHPALRRSAEIAAIFPDPRPDYVQAFEDRRDSADTGFNSIAYLDAPTSPPTDPDQPGRFWGVVGRQFLPLASSETYSIYLNAERPYLTWVVSEFRRYARAAMGNLRRLAGELPSFTYYGDAVQWLRLWRFITDEFFTDRHFGSKVHIINAGYITP